MSGTALNTSGLIYEKRPPLALLVIDRPSQNRITSSLINVMLDAVQDISVDTEIRAVILTAEGERHFCAGFDLEELSTLNPEEARTVAISLHSLIEALERLGRPVIAALNGSACGSGMDLALAATMRIAADHALLGYDETGLGLLPGLASARRLARIVGLGRAQEMLLTGVAVSAQEAFTIGLVNSVTTFRDLFRSSKELAQKLSALAPLPIKYSLDALRHGLEMPSDEAVFLESTLFSLCFATEDFKEGISAYLEKRPARFKGR